MKDEEKIFGLPIKTYKDADDLLKMMIESDGKELFLLASVKIKNQEGNDSINLIWAKIYRTKETLINP